MVGVRGLWWVGEVDGDGERVPSLAFEPLTSLEKKFGAIARTDG